MATVRSLSQNPNNCQPSSRASGRIFAMLATCCRSIARLFTWTKKGRAVPVIHEEVTLSEKGAELWKQIEADPNSKIGRPIGHKRHRIESGGD